MFSFASLGVQQEDCFLKGQTVFNCFQTEVFDEIKYNNSLALVLKPQEYYKRTFK